MSSKRLNPFAVIQKYYDPASELYRILAAHSVLVAAKALALARDFHARHPESNLDLEFIEEAALLHDIGIFRCDAPAIFCFGKEPYIKHTILGREILEKEGLPRHALVCERHTGMGLTAEEVVQQNLPLPVRDYLPLSLEEKIICMADRFYIKLPAKLYEELMEEQVRQKLATYGSGVLRRWEEMRRLLLSSTGANSI